MSTSSVNETASSRPETDVPAGTPADKTKEPQPDVSIDEVVGAITDLIDAKKLQFTAQWRVVGAEAKLLRQSILVTALATLAAFAFGCVGWLIINAASAVLLAKAGLHAAIVALVLLAINGLLMFAAWRVAKDAFSHISVNPLVNAVKGDPSVSRETDNEKQQDKQND